MKFSPLQLKNIKLAGVAIQAFCILAIAPILSQAQIITNPQVPPVIKWDTYNDSYSGSTHREDWFYNVQTDQLGGFIGAGYAENISSGMKFGFAARFNANGGIMHQATFFTSYTNGSYFLNCLALSNGDYAFVGWANNGTQKVALVVVDTAFTTILSTTFSLSASTTLSYAEAIAEVIDPGGATSVQYVISGVASGTNLSSSSSNDGFVLRLDGSYAQIGSVTFIGNRGGYVGGDDAETVGITYARGIDPVNGPQGSPTGIAVAGFSVNATSQDIFVTKLNFSGGYAWSPTTTQYYSAPADNSTNYIYGTDDNSSPNKWYDHPDSFQNPRAGSDQAGYIAQVNNGDLVMFAQYNFLFRVDADGFLVRMDSSNGTLISQKNISHFSGDDMRNRFVQTADDGFAFVGSTADSIFRDGMPMLDSWNGEDILVGKTDGSFNVLWRRHLHGTYQQTTSNGTCGFGIAYAKDGGYAVCGNNADENDDAVIIRLTPECEANLVVNGTTIIAGHTLSSNETWASNKTVKGLIIVPSGKTLTINGPTIQFAFSRYLNDYTSLSNAGIQVQKNGKLIVEGGAILKGVSGCDGGEYTWDGVVVNGDPTLNEIITNQGSANIGNSTIENAVTGVMASASYFYSNPNAVNNLIGGWHYSSTINKASVGTTAGSDGGGLITASNSTFKNSRVECSFDPYPNGGYSFGSLSSFEDCSFLTDNYLVDPSEYDKDGNRIGNNQMVSMWGINGIYFTSNSFSNTTTTSPALLGIGMSSADAGYTLTRKCLASENGCCTSFDADNTFSGLFYGINASFTGTTTPAIIMDNAEFDNTFQDVYVSGSKGGLYFVTNTFNVPNDDVYADDYGLYLDGCTGYWVEDNQFTGTTASGNYGIIVKEGANDDNSIYRNYFNKMNFSTEAFKQNGNSTDGLQFLCNQYNTGDKYDFDVESKVFGSGSVTPGGSVKGGQGYVQSNPVAPDYYTAPAGNTFNNSCPSNGHAHIHADSHSTAFTYVYNQSGTNFQPNSSCVTASLVTLVNDGDGSPSDDPRACPSQLATCGTELVAQINSYTKMVRLLKYEMAKVSPDDRTDMGQQISDLNAQLTSALYLLVDEYLKVGLFDSAAKAFEDAGLLSEAIPMYVTAGNYAEANSLLTSWQPHTDADVQYKNLISIGLPLYTSGKTWMNIDDSQGSEIKSIAVTETPAAREAQNILYLVYGIHPTIEMPDPEIEDSTQGRSESATPQVSTFSIYPNPTADEINIELNGLASGEQATCIFYNLFGQQVYSLQASNGLTVLESHAIHIPSGVYVIHCETNKNGSFNQKLIIQ